jgi:hypothetical protein
MESYKCLICNQTLVCTKNFAVLKCKHAFCASCIMSLNGNCTICCNKKKENIKKLNEINTVIARSYSMNNITQKERIEILSLKISVASKEILNSILNQLDFNMELLNSILYIVLK